MHELSIALGIVDVAGEELARHPGAAIVAVHVRIGELSGVVKEALVSAFEMARYESELSQALLCVEEVPVTLFCATCQAEQPAASAFEMCCRQCGTYSQQVLKGRELEVVALEFES